MSILQKFLHFFNDNPSGDSTMAKINKLLVGEALVSIGCSRTRP